MALGDASTTGGVGQKGSNESQVNELVPFPLFFISTLSAVGEDDFDFDLGIFVVADGVVRGGWR